MNLTERVRWTRRKTGLSQAQLAELIGVSRSAVANWEGSGPTGPSHENLERLAKIAHVPFDWLATGRGEIEQPPHLHDVPVAHAEFVEEDAELRLLHDWRACSAKVRVASQELIGELAHSRQGKNKPLARPHDGMTEPKRKRRPKKK